MTTTTSNKNNNAVEDAFHGAYDKWRSTQSHLTQEILEKPALDKRAIERLCQRGLTFQSFLNDPYGVLVKDGNGAIAGRNTEAAVMMPVSLNRVDSFACNELRLPQGATNRRRLWICMQCARDAGETMCAKKGHAVTAAIKLWKKWNKEHKVEATQQAEHSIWPTFANLLMEHPTPVVNLNIQDWHSKSPLMVSPNGEWWYSRQDWVAEDFVARLAVSSKRPIANSDFEARRLVARVKLTHPLTPEQLAAVLSALTTTRHIHLITGVAGSGKTEVAKVIASCISLSSGNSVPHAPWPPTTTTNETVGCFRACDFRAVAFTGRAAKNLAERGVDEFAMTVHKYAFHRHRRVHATLALLVDECSMVSMPLLRMLCRRHHNVDSCPRLFMFGDHCQLKPVGKCSLIHELLDCSHDLVSRSQLTRPMRTSNSDFLRLAHLVHNWGQLPEYENVQSVIADFVRTGTPRTGCFQFHVCQTQQQVRDTAQRLYLTSFINRLSNRQDSGSAYSQLLFIVPNSSEGDQYLLSNRSLNEPIRKEILQRCPVDDDDLLLMSVEEVAAIKQQRAEDQRKALVTGKCFFVVNDKVSARKNDYDPASSCLAMARGELAQVLNVHDADHKARAPRKIDLLLADGTIHLQKTSEDFEHAHAITVHKSQSLGVEEVIVAFHEKCGECLMSRELLYTAMTRAKTKLVLVGSVNALKLMLTSKRTDANIKYSHLPRRAKVLAAGNRYLELEADSYSDDSSEEEFC